MKLNNEIIERLKTLETICDEEQIITYKEQSKNFLSIFDNIHFNVIPLIGVTNSGHLTLEFNRGNNNYCSIIFENEIICVITLNIHSIPQLLRSIMCAADLIDFLHNRKLI